MADPYIGAPAIFFFVEATVPQPEVTTPETVALGFTGLDGASGAPQFSFKDDAGVEYFLYAMTSAPTGEVPYGKNGAWYPSILQMSGDLLYMILDGNLYLGVEDGSGAVNRRLIFVTGASAGTIELAANGSDDGNQHAHYLPQTDAATVGQVIGVSAITGGSTHQWDFQTADVCLARGVSVDLNSTTKQTLYTVPTGRSCIITKVVQRDASAAVTTAVGAYGFNANADDVVASFNVFTNMTGTGVYDIKNPAAPAVKGSSANTFGYKGSVAEGATRTMTVDVFGYLL